MELSFCAATPILTRCPRRRKRTRCVTRMDLESNRRRDEGHSLLRAPEAIAAIFTVGAALFRDILRGDGDGIRARLNARLRAQAEQRARSKMLLETQKEVRSLNQAIMRERERAKPMILEKQNLLNRAVETLAIEALANAVTDDEIELPPEGILKGEKDKGFETEIRQLISKARQARRDFQGYMDKNKGNLKEEIEKRSIEDIEAETIAADALAKQYQMELKDVKSATKSLEKEKQAEMDRLKNVLETHQKRIEEFRKIAEQMDEEKRKEEAEALKSKSTVKQEIASEKSLREVRKEVNAANKLAKNIVETATKAVKSAEDGNMKAVDDLGDSLRGDLNNAERQMKTAQKNKGKKERKMRLSAVQNVLETVETESKEHSSPVSTPISKKETTQTSSKVRKIPTVNANQKVVPSSSLPEPTSAKPSLEQKPASTAAAASFISDSVPGREEIILEPKVEDVLEEAASTVDSVIEDASRDAESTDNAEKNLVDAIDDEILKKEIELALDLEEFEKQKAMVGSEDEEKFLELEEPPKELLESITSDLDVIEEEGSIAPVLFEEEETEKTAVDVDEIDLPVQKKRRRWSADDEMGDLNDSDVLKATNDDEDASEAGGELPNITDGFSIEDLEESEDSDDDENSNSKAVVAEGSNTIMKKTSAKKNADDDVIEPFAGAEGKKETLELLRVIETAGEGVAREGDWSKKRAPVDIEKLTTVYTEPEAAVDEAPKKRRRGRPRKVKDDTTATVAETKKKEEEVPKVKRKRGRPRKSETTASTTTTVAKKKTTKEEKADESAEAKPKRKRGRPRKNAAPSTTDDTTSV